jgi:GT2 family glycosyltransferase
VALGAPDRHGAHRVALLLLLFAPFDWLILVALFCAEIVGRVCRRIAPKTPPAFPPLQPECSFVILSWNSQAMLEESLPPLFEAVGKDGVNHEIIVVDNNSTDGTEEYIRRRFPGVRLVSSQKNIYFGAGNRLGIETATRDILVLMNNDTVVNPGFLPPLLAALRDPAVFGVASAVVRREPQQCCETGNTHAYFNGTHLEWRHDPISDLKNGSQYPIFWLHRGLFAVDRRKYTWLGGFDSLYDPLYMEDADLSYRAWKVGWKCLLATGSQVSHHHHLGTPAAGEVFLRTIARRNHYMFFWKNINALAITAQYLWRSSWARVCRARLSDDRIGQEIRSLFGALERLPRVLMRRVTTRRSTTRSDQEVFDLTAGSEDGSQEQR